MTEQHICPIHGVPFKRFEKGGQFWYSHKDGDKWCAEKKAEADTTVIEDKPKPDSGAMTKADWAEKDRITCKSIERQKSLEIALRYTERDAEPITPGEVIDIARLFEAYLDGSLKPPARQSLAGGKDVSTPIKDVSQAPARRTETLAGEPTQAVERQTIDPELVPKSVGQLYNWMRRYVDRKVLPRDFALSCGVTEEQLKSDVPSAYKIVKGQNKDWKEYPN